MDVQRLQKRLREFTTARDWGQFHSPKNLAMALVAEVGELVEQFQWLTDEQSRQLRARCTRLGKIYNYFPPIRFIS